MVKSGQDVKLQQLERFDNAKQREWKGKVVGICVLIPSWDSIFKLRGTHTSADSEPNLQFSGDQLTQLLKHSSLIH